MENKILLNQHQQRNSSIELCRILSMLMIVGCHFATHGGFNFDKSTITIPRMWWYVIEMGGNFGVDVFIIITGYFLVNHTEIKIDVKKAFMLWGQVFFYSLVFYVLSLIVGINQFSTKELIKSIFPVTSGAWWFVTNYFVLFLIHPFINKLLFCLDKKQYQRLLLLLGFIWCIIPKFTSLSFASNELWQFVVIYAIGGYIKLYGNKTKLNSHHFFCLWIVTTVITFLSSIAFVLLGKKFTFFAEHALLFYGRVSLPTLLRAVFFFMIFEKKPSFNSKIVNIISSATFGVYLIHDNCIVRPALWKSIFVNAQYQESIMLIPYSIVVALLVYVVCSLIDIIRSKTIEILYIRLINNHINRIKAPLRCAIERIEKLLFGND